jgi:hypothetical protein
MAGINVTCKATATGRRLFSSVIHIPQFRHPTSSRTLSSLSPSSLKWTVWERKYCNHDLFWWKSLDLGKKLTLVRPLSTLIANAFWKSLDDAMQDGDGASAQRIVNEVLQEYKNRLQNGPTINGTAQKEQLDARMFSMVLQAWKNGRCATVDSALRAEEVLEYMFSFAQKGITIQKPSISDYMAVLECWRQASVDADSSSVIIWNHAEKVWNLSKEEAISNGFEEQFYQILLDILANVGQGDRAEQYLEEYKQNRLNDGKIRKNEAFLVSNEMCLSALQAHIHSPEKESIDKAELFLSKMLTDPLLPNPSSYFYNFVLKAWSSSSKERNFSLAATRAEKLLGEMKEARVQPDAISYQSCLEILARLGEGVRAEALLTNLLKEYTNQFDAGLKPGIEPFRTVLWAFSNSSHPDAATHAESILNNMIELAESNFDTVPTTLDYNLVLKCWSRSRSPLAVEQATKLYNRMVDATAAENSQLKDVHQGEGTPGLGQRRSFATPDTTSLNTLLNTSGQHEPAAETETLLWKLLNRHLHEPEMNPCPDTISFSIVIRSWNKARDHDAPERAEKLLRHLEALYNEGMDKCKPDLHIYSLLMNCWAKSKRKEAPMRVESFLRRLQSMARNGDVEMTPDSPSWNITISAWVGDGHKAETLFMEMIETGRNNPSAAVAPTFITLTNVMNAWAKTRSKDASKRAVDLLRKMQQLYNDGIINVTPNVICYSLVLESLAHQRTLSSAIEAEAMLREMQASSDPTIHPNVVSYNCVIKAWSYSGYPGVFTKATALLREVIDQSKNDKTMKPNAKTFGGVLKCLAGSNIPDKKAPGKLIILLMKKFDCKQDKWIQNVLADCLRNKIRTKGGSD